MELRKMEEDIEEPEDLIEEGRALRQTNGE